MSLLDLVRDTLAAVTPSPWVLPKPKLGQPNNLQPLLVDVYSGDLHGEPSWTKLSQDKRFAGAVLKATEGTSYRTAWFETNWKSLLATDPTWARGAYHFLRFDQPGRLQAEFYMKTITAAGGFSGSRALLPIVDVELGGERHPNRHASKNQVIDVTSAWVKKIKELTGQRVMLYGNGAMRDLNIRDRMGADILWIPRYTATLPKVVYERAGWTLDAVGIWQFCGDGVGKLAGYPMVVDGFGRVDISVLLVPIEQILQINTVTPHPVPTLTKP